MCFGVLGQQGCQIGGPITNTNTKVPQSNYFLQTTIFLQMVPNEYTVHVCSDSCTTKRDEHPGQVCGHMCRTLPQLRLDTSSDLHFLLHRWEHNAQLVLGPGGWPHVQNAQPRDAMYMCGSAFSAPPLRTHNTVSIWTRQVATCAKQTPT